MAVQVLPRENKSPWLPLLLLLQFMFLSTRDWKQAAQISVLDHFGTSEAALGFSVVPMILYVVSIHLPWIPVTSSKDPQLLPESCCPASSPATVLKVHLPRDGSAGQGACFETQQSVFDPWDIHSDKKELTFASCPLTFTCTLWETYLCTCAHPPNKYNWKKNVILNKNFDWAWWYVCLKSQHTRDKDRQHTPGSSSPPICQGYTVRPGLKNRYI